MEIQPFPPVTASFIQWRNNWFFNSLINTRSVGPFASALKKEHPIHKQLWKLICNIIFSLWELKEKTKNGAVFCEKGKFHGTSGSLGICNSFDKIIPLWEDEELEQT